MKNVIVCSLVLIISSFVIAQGGPVINIPLQFSNGVENRVVYFGIDPEATEGIDESLGEANLPPMPPIEVMEIRFHLPENTFSGTLSSYADYRTGTIPFSGQVEHRLRLQKGSGDSLSVLWDFPLEISCTLKDLGGGVLVNQELTGSGSYTIPNPDFFAQLQLLINYNNATNIRIEENIIPISAELYQNYPNPFNPETVIRFQLIKQSDVTLFVYDMLGNKVAEVVNDNLSAGTYSVSLNAAGLSSGMYFYQLRTTDFIKTRKMTLIK